VRVDLLQKRRSRWQDRLVDGDEFGTGAQHFDNNGVRGTFFGNAIDGCRNGDGPAGHVRDGMGLTLGDGRPSAGRGHGHDRTTGQGRRDRSWCGGRGCTDRSGRGGRRTRRWKGFQAGGAAHGQRRHQGQPACAAHYPFVQHTNVHCTTVHSLLYGGRSHTRVFPAQSGHLPRAPGNGQSYLGCIGNSPTVTRSRRPRPKAMSSALLLRLGAPIALIANVLIGFLFPDHNDVRAPLQPLYVPLNIASVIGVTMLLFGLPGWYARHSSRLGRAGTLGLALIAVTLLVEGLFIGLYEAVFLPAAATQAPQLIAPGPDALVVVLALGVLAEIIGPLLLGYQLQRRGIGPRWVAICLMVSAPVTVAWFVSLLVDGDGPPSPFTILGNVVSAALLFIALGGLATGSAARSMEPHQPVAVPSVA
jgi:hypothetical protein